ncbi:IS3 family transposase [Peribacillus asahii]|uniref:IS3 family transposase n=1 Tax=Peribacillus asahii TaxID=228899 RepID=UPI0022069A54|nr:IS3 family transposase [Peribacillus asahii]
MDYYNNKRIKQQLAGMSPVQYRLHTRQLRINSNFLGANPLNVLLLFHLELGHFYCSPIPVRFFDSKLSSNARTSSVDAVFIN